MKHVNSYNLFQLSCATSDIMFNLFLQLQYLAEVEGRHRQMVVKTLSPGKMRKGL